MRINLKDFGGFLSSSDLGKRIAISVLDSLRKEPDNNVILDFSGVPGVNKHFCEEFLTLIFRGIGYEEFRKKVVLQNQTAVVKLIFDTVAAQKKGIVAEGINNVIGEPIHTVHIEKKEVVVEVPQQAAIEQPKGEIKEGEIKKVAQNMDLKEESIEKVKVEARVEEEIEEIKEEGIEVKIEEKREKDSKGRKKKESKPARKAKEVSKPKSTVNKVSDIAKKPKATTKKTTGSKKK
ncbi:MAG: STAS-like domain-containing protein [Myxococcota bacterium]